MTEAEAIHSMKGDDNEDAAADPAAQRKGTRDEEAESASLGKLRNKKSEHASYDDAEEVRLFGSVPS